MTPRISDPRTANREPRTANRESRTANREPRTVNRESRTASSAPEPLDERRHCLCDVGFDLLRERRRPRLVAALLEALRCWHVAEPAVRVAEVEGALER